MHFGFDRPNIPTTYLSEKCVLAEKEFCYAYAHNKVKGKK